jgi:hypothetical protein
VASDREQSHWQRLQQNHQQQQQQYHTPNNQNRGRQQQNRPQNSSPLINHNMNKEWQAMTQSFHIASYLSKNDQTNQAPSHNGKTFCIMFHAVGKCKRGIECPYKHAHPMSCGKGKEFTEFLRKMTDSKKSKPANH